MSNVFLTGLTNDHRARLASANVPCYDLALGEEFGIMIEQQHLDAALVALGAYVDSQEPSGFEGIAKAVLKAKAPGQATKAHKVTNNWKGKETDDLHESVRQFLVPVIDREVLLHHSQGHASEPVNDGKFHIHLYCSPVRYAEPGATPPALIWGIPNASRNRSFHASGRGVAIVDEATGYPYAEYVAPNNVYVHMNFFDKYDGNSVRIFRVMMQKLASIVGLSADDHRSVMRKRFIEECSKVAVRVVRDTADSGTDHELPAGLRNHSSSLHSNSRFDGANGLQPGEKSVSAIGTSNGYVDPKKLQERKANVQALRKRLTHAISEARAKERKLLTDENVNLDEFGIEYENLMKVKYVKDVKVEGNAIVIYTDILDCKDERTHIMHEIGAFKISLPFTGSMPSWKNLTRTVNGMKAGQHAPHVWPDGTACLGNTADIFPKLFAQRQWSIAAQLAIEFVQAANTSDAAGKHISSWPRSRR